MRSPWMGTTFLALNDPHFRRLFFGLILTYLAFGMLFVVQGIVAFDLTGKNSAVGLIALGTGTTQMVTAPFGGAVIDRFSKRNLLMLGQIGLALICAATGALVLTDSITLPLLLVSALAIGATLPVIGPIRLAWTSDLLQGDARANGMALTQVGQSASRLVGPFVAGGLVALRFVGSGGSYLFMAALFIGGTMLIVGMPSGQGRRIAGQSILQDTRRGIGYLMRTGDVRLLVLSQMAMTIATMPHVSIMPGFIENELGHSSTQLGLVFGISAGGAIVASVALARTGASAQRTMVMLGVLSGVSLIALSLAPTFASALVAIFWVGAFLAAYLLANNVALAQQCAREYYGRIISIVFISFGVQGVVAYPLGLLADAIGERTSLLACGMLALLVTALNAVEWYRLQGRNSLAAAVDEIERLPRT